MINPQKPVINLIKNFNHFTALVFLHGYSKQASTKIADAEQIKHIACGAEVTEVRGQRGHVMAERAIALVWLYTVTRYGNPPTV